MFHMLLWWTRYLTIEDAVSDLSILPRPLQRSPTALVDSFWKNKKLLTASSVPLCIRALSLILECSWPVPKVSQSYLRVNVPGATPNQWEMEVGIHYPSCFLALSWRSSSRIPSPVSLTSLHPHYDSWDLLPNKLLKPKSMFQSLHWGKPTQRYSILITTQWG